MNTKSPSAKLLAACRDAALLRTIWMSAKSRGCQVEIAATIRDALERLQSGMQYDLLLVELPAADQDGLQKTVERYLVNGEFAPVSDGWLIDGVGGPECTNWKEPVDGNPPESSTSTHLGDILSQRSLRSLLQSVREEAERNAIVTALGQTGWNRKAAARLLKVSYRTILYKIDKYHLNPDDHAGSQISDRLDSGATKARLSGFPSSHEMGLPTGSDPRPWPAR
jgi:hypothetical protein